MRLSFCHFGFVRYPLRWSIARKSVGDYLCYLPIFFGAVYGIHRYRVPYYLHFFGPLSGVLVVDIPVGRVSRVLARTWGFFGLQ